MGRWNYRDDIGIDMLPELPVHNFVPNKVLSNILKEN